jgi:chromosomal replication initiator protein
MLLVAAAGRSVTFRNINKPQVRDNMIKSIQEAVAYLFGLSAEELRQESKRQVVAVPRQIAIYLVKQMTDASLPEIGRQFGGKHHSTVMYSIAKIDERRRTDADLNHVISELLQSLADPQVREFYGSCHVR